MKYFDTHTHLNELSFTTEERLERIASLENSNVDKIVDIGFDVESSIIALEHASIFPWCYCAVGVHPHDTDHMTEEDYEKIKSLALSSKKVVAIGEIGLDYHYDKEWEEKQKYWFKRQIELSNELGLPMSIHSRDADLDTLNCLIEAGAFKEERLSKFSDHMPHIVIHCYSGSNEFSKEYLKRGCFLGFDGPITFKNNRRGIEVVEAINLSQLVLETDAPYLAPVPHRGEDNRSEYIGLVGAKIAELRKMSEEEIAKITYDNALRLFNL